MGTEAHDWLRNKSQTELWVLAQRGNPQEILAYSLALTSHLNQVAPRTSTRLSNTCLVFYSEQLPVFFCPFNLSKDGGQGG